MVSYTDLTKIINRLELIKNLIALEEVKEIETHVLKLNDYFNDKELSVIIAQIEKKEYNKVIVEIENYINKHRQLTNFVDPEIEALRLEAKFLEAEINELSDEKADLEKLIHDFGVRHNNELGELILRILRFRKKQAKGTSKEKEAEQDYNEYSKEFEKSRDEKNIELTDNELKELKQKYRKASKLCHPDVVNEDQKELADKLFAELSAAYEKNDLERVREILTNLEKGNLFVSKSDAITEKQLMRAEIGRLRLKIKELKEQLQAIKESEAYKTISRIEDWDVYFSETKNKLEEQAKELEGGGE